MGALGAVRSIPAWAGDHHAQVGWVGEVRNTPASAGITRWATVPGLPPKVTPRGTGAPSLSSRSLESLRSTLASAGSTWSRGGPWSC